MCCIVYNCANRGTPSGGDIDEKPPIILKSEPENFSSEFNSKEIKIYFDEYIKLKNLQKQLIISPPIDPQPEITPLGSASKFITIKINDTLNQNTTYAFNFGESVVDNNADNIFSNYKYVFSTGRHIDSLKLYGKVIDSYDRKLEKDINILLYEIDSSFTDSIVYKTKPKYISKVVDSTSEFVLENLKKGKYLLICLKEENKDYVFQPLNDKIGYLDNYISIPTNSNIIIKLFKEELDFKFSRPKQKSSHSLAFGFQGFLSEFKINQLLDFDSVYNDRLVKSKDSDTLYYWYKTNSKVDSLQFKITTNNQIDTLIIKTRNMYKDSLKIESLQSNYISFLDDIKLTANIPFDLVKPKKIIILNKDSIRVNYKYEFDTLSNTYNFEFDKKQEEKYEFRILPGAFKDFYNNLNDSINYTFKTKTYDDYGNLRFIIRNETYPIIVQLVNSIGETKYEKYIENSNSIDFKYLRAGKYFVRLIFDTNNNKRYDSGDFLKKRKPEKVIYYPDELDIRAGWDLVEEFILK